MIHDIQLLQKLQRYPVEKFDGLVYRVTSMNADPIAASTSGGRWAPPSLNDESFPVLYTSLDREGAIAEVASYLLEQTPIPSKPLVIHELAVTTSRTLGLLRENLSALSLEITQYDERNYIETQTIGAAINFLELDGLIAPSAQWNYENLIIYGESFLAREA